MQAELSAQQYLTLDCVPRLSMARLLKLQEHCSLSELFLAPQPQLLDWGLNPAQAKVLQSPDLKKINACLDWLDHNPCQLIGYFDPAYPEALRQIQRPPLVLFCRGDTRLLKRQQIAIVGSRHPSPVGQQQAEDFAKAIAAQGLTITSGLAIGIDGSAHKGALQARPDATIAVVATGLDRVYPKRHQALAYDIVEHSLMISEFWPGAEARAHHFPRRNRIISGLSLGVLVIEAALPSGSLLTANYAAEQGRDVFAIPGSIDDPLRRGCHHLIQQGAKLASAAADILDEYEEQLSLSLSPASPPISEEDPHPQLPNSSLLDNVSYESTSIDQLVALSQQPVDEVLTQLMELELLGVVAAVPGGYVRLRRNDHV